MAQHTFSYSFSKAVLVCCSEVCTSEICVTIWLYTSRDVLHIIKKYKGTCLSKPGSWMLTLKILMIQDSSVSDLVRMMSKEVVT